MFAQERQKQILSLLERKRRLKVHDLQRHLKVSSATLRRDLSEMEKTDRIVRVHGGVIHPAFFAGEPSLEEKRRSSLREKREIAIQVNMSIPDGSSILIDSGSTCLEAAKLLKDRSDLTLITNSTPLLQSCRNRQARVISLGGEVRSISGAMVGSLTLKWLQQIRADFALIGASGLSVKGPSTTELQECAVKQAMIQSTGKAWLLVDHTKWNHPSVFNFAALSDFDRIFCDKALPLPKTKEKKKKQP